MATRTSYSPGTFSWVDLQTSDPEAAKTFYGPLFGWELEEMPTDQDAASTFYGALFGWTYEDHPMGPSGTYRTIQNGDRPNGGIRLLTEQETAAGVPPNWLVYFTTEDVDGSATKVGELGGAVLAPPMQLPMGSRIAVVADPQGAAFALFEGEVQD